MSGIEPVFWSSFRRLGRACLRRYLASTLVYCLVLGSWSYAINRLLDGVLGTSSSWWWIVGLSCLLWLLVRVRRVGAFSAEWVEQCSRKLFAHDELGNALDFLKRTHRSTFMKAHLINTGRVLARMRVPWFYFFSKRHWLVLWFVESGLGSLGLVGLHCNRNSTRNGGAASGRFSISAPTAVRRSRVAKRPDGEQTSSFGRPVGAFEARSGAGGVLTSKRG